METAINLKKKLEQAFNPSQADVLAEVITEAYSDLVKTSDFNELKGIVKELAEAQKELAEAQKESQKEIGRLDRTMQELAEAQKRTEARVEELAEAQKRTEARVEELAEAQKRTEARVEELAEAQKKTEIKVEELAESQKRTERELRELIGEHKKTREQLGGLSATVGYRLEDEAFKALPGLLKRDFGLIIEGKLKRKLIVDDRGKEIEVNIIGEATKNGKKVTIIGESKSQLSKKGVNEFIRKKVRRLEGRFKEIFPVLVTYMITESDVEEYAKNKGIALYYSYDF